LTGVFLISDKPLISLLFFSFIFAFLVVVHFDQQPLYSVRTAKAPAGGRFLEAVLSIAYSNQEMSKMVKKMVKVEKF